MTGGFNFNMLSEQSSRKILDICQQFSLYQIISEPTHFAVHSSSLIDIVLTSDRNNLIYCRVTDPFLHQDVRYHCPIYGILKFFKHARKSFTHRIWSYDRGNYDRLRSKAANTDWNTLSDRDTNIYVKNITDHMNLQRAECIPNKSVRITPPDPPWIITAIKKQIRKRAYKKAKRLNTTRFWNKFKKRRNSVISAIRQSTQDYLNQLSNKLQSVTLSSKDWWTSLKAFLSPSTNSSVPTLEKDSCVFSDDTEKANLLNDFFRDQTSLDGRNARVPDVEVYVGDILSTLVISPLEIESVMKSLSLGKAVGSDDINKCILRELAHELSYPLCSLINQSLQLGLFPDTWKDALVCLIFKGGESTSVPNYRPISLLSCLEKVCERVVFKHLYNHFHDNRILTPLQSGFMPRDSTTNQLTFLYNSFCLALDSGKEARVVFCDVSKAFDRVWHQGLLCKLRAAGISGNMLSWIAVILLTEDRE